MNDETLLRRAIELASTHSESGENGPFGAVVARDGVGAALTGVASK